jgi:hypothetical protein
VANALAAASKDHRVYSESAPVISLLHESVCRTNSEECRSMLRDLIYLMSRGEGGGGPLRTFFKFQSALTLKMDIILAAFPEVPWIFVYREGVQVLMSHLGSSDVLTKGRPVGNAPNCAKGRSRPTSDIMKVFGDVYDGDGAVGSKRLKGRVDGLDDESYCAAHLSSLCRKAVDMIRADGESGEGSDATATLRATKGWLVNYENIVEVVKNNVLPDHFNVHLSEVENGRIDSVSNVYSKARKEGVEFENDSAKKDRYASDGIKKASELFLDDVYHVMKEITEGQWKE